MGKKVNFLELKPLRKREWEDIGDGRVAVFQPRFFNNLAKKYIEPLLKRPTVKVRLDREGTFTWMLCDGSRTMAEIGEMFKQEFSCEDAIERLQSFMQYLERCEMIEFANLEEVGGK